MKDSSFPPRLSDSGGDDALLRDVLRAAKDETMAPSRVARSLATFDATKLPIAAPAGAAAEKATSRWRTLAAQLGASVVIVCAIGVSFRMRNAVTEAPAPLPPSPSAPAVVHLAEPASTRAPDTETAAVTRVEDLPAAPPAVEGTTTDRSTAKGPSPSTTSSPSGPAAPSSATPSSRATAASSFHEELALVEAARSALARGDSESCLRALDRHDERFRGGVFADEILVMRVEALAARGEHGRARALGDAFLAKSPNSAYASRIRSILDHAPSGASR